MADPTMLVGNALGQFQQGQEFAQKMQTQDLANQETQARIPGIQGQSASLQAKGQVDSANIDQAIQATRSDLMAKMTGNDAKMMTDFGGQLGQFGAMLGQVPPPARAAAVAQYAARFGMNQDSPILQGLLKTDPEKLPDVIKTMGSSMVQMSSDYIKGAGLLGIKGQTATQVAGINAGAKIDAAKMRADSAELVANLNNASQEKRAEATNQLKIFLQNNKARSPGQLVAQLTQQYQETKDPEDLARLSQAIDVAQAVSQNPALTKMFQEQAVAGSVLGPSMPQTVPPPPANPTANFPTNKSQGPAGLPQGAKQIGTSKGKPVYELPDGRRIVAQ